MGHDLAIPHSVHSEIRAGPAAGACQRLIDARKITVMDVNSRPELCAFKESHPRLGFGEIDVMLTYEKISGGRSAYCVLDDKDARRTAASMGIRFVGLYGLLRLMNRRGILASDELGSALGVLRQSGFRLP